MGQVFGPGANAIARAVIIAVPVAGVMIVLAAIIHVRAPGVTGAGRVVEQPVPFSHAHHVGGLGIDCRYCHSSVETSPFAGLPPTETCMTCHSQLWTNADMLAPVRESLRDGRPLRWRRVHDLPDYVYFDHSIHVAKGVACETCHGRVDQMPLMEKHASLTMGWCLDCHRHPERYIRPVEHVFDMGWVPPAGTEQIAMGRALIAAYGIHTRQLTDCSVCHR
jgi:hypothetical protein